MENLVKKLGADGVEAKRQVNKKTPADLRITRTDRDGIDGVDGCCRTLTLPCGFGYSFLLLGTVRCFFAVSQ